VPPPPPRQVGPPGLRAERLHRRRWPAPWDACHLRVPSCDPAPPPPPMRVAASSAPPLAVALAALALTIPMRSSMPVPTFVGSGPCGGSVDSTSAVVGIHRMLRGAPPPSSGSAALLAAAPHFVDHLLPQPGRQSREGGTGSGSPGTWSPRQPSVHGTAHLGARLLIAQALVDCR